MIPILKALAAFALLVVVLLAGTVADYTLNDSRILYALVGRDRLVDACLPELEKGLVDRGFAPTDVEFATRPHIAIGRTRTFGSEFTFLDGPAETRVDGVVACAVTASGVHVDFKTSARPLRAG